MAEKQPEKYKNKQNSSLFSLGWMMLFPQLCLPINIYRLLSFSNNTQVDNENEENKNEHCIVPIEEQPLISHSLSRNENMNNNENEMDSIVEAIDNLGGIVKVLEEYIKKYPLTLSEFYDIERLANENRGNVHHDAQSDEQYNSDNDVIHSEEKATNNYDPSHSHNNNNNNNHNNNNNDTDSNATSDNESENNSKTDEEEKLEIEYTVKAKSPFSHDKLLNAQSSQHTEMNFIVFGYIRRCEQELLAHHKNQSYYQIPITISDMCLTYAYTYKYFMKPESIPSLNVNYKDSNFRRMYKESNTKEYTKRDILNALKTLIPLDKDEVDPENIDFYNYWEKLMNDQNKLGWSTARMCIYCWTLEIPKFHGAIKWALCSDNKVELEGWMPFIRTLNTKLVNRHPKKMSLYRGSRMQKQDWAKLSPGVVFRHPSYIATSNAMEVAQTWRGMRYLIKYQVPANCANAAEIHQWSKYPNEHEVLLPPYTAVRVIKTGAVSMEVEVLDNIEVSCDVKGFKHEEKKITKSDRKNRDPEELYQYQDLAKACRVWSTPLPDDGNRFVN